MTDISLVEARRIALRAQGFDSAETSRPTLTKARKVVSRLGAVQIDSVSILVRAHYLALFSRLGPYDRKLFDRLASPSQGAFEHWAHAASFVPLDLYPAWRWQMDDYARFHWWLRAQDAIEKRNAGYRQRVLDEVAERGPLSYGQLADPARHDRLPSNCAASTLMWFAKRPSDGKRVLEGLWREGRLAVTGRGAGFERVFDLTERMIPAEVLNQPTPPREEGQRRLLLRAVRAMGIGWVPDIANYFWTLQTETKARLKELVEAGSIQAVKVEGTGLPAYMDPAAKAQPITASALLSPFDSLLWQRARNVRLLGFRHSFEMYTPEKKRQYGYYVLPFLMGESITARVDLKADRATSTLVVPGAFAEQGVQPKEVAGELASALRRLAAWLGLEKLRVETRGDLAPALRRAL